MAYIYVKGPSGWPTTPTTTLADPAANDNDSFGYSVAASGETAVVGAHGTSSGAGTAYIYVKGTSAWRKKPTTTLQDPGAHSADYFGNSVAVAGNTVVVGAYNSNSGTGTAYIYVEGTDGWSTTPTTTLQDPGAHSADDYGDSVGVSGATVVIAAFGTNSSAGAAYIYVKGSSGWPTAPSATLQDPGATGGDEFGDSVGVSGAAIVVGAQGMAPGGAGYIYVKGVAGWPLCQL